MQVYGSIIPGGATLARLLPQQAAEARAEQRRALSRASPEAVLSGRAKCRLNVIRWHEGHGRNVTRTANHFNYSRPTIHAWLERYRRAGPKGLEDRSRRPLRLRTPTWSGDLERRVLALREQFPRWGKDKLVILLRREGVDVSTSMVGRILKLLKDTGQLVEALPERRKSRKYLPRPYAIRKPRGYLAKNPGDLVEVDSVDLRPLPGVILKHFTARDIVSRWDFLGVFSRATANTAAQFLDGIIARSLFPIKAVQVDGGSEFKAEFEAACQKKGLPLFVLPPCSPKLNGCVERANRTHREEFYEVYDLDWTVAGLRPALSWWEGVYNTVRPHEALSYQTPMEYVTQWRLGRPGKEVV